MDDDNNNPTPPAKLSLAYSAVEALTVELAKILALVAASSMTAAQQEVWLRSATEALEDLLPFDAAGICVEVRRTVTRASQIVPEIARLVSERNQPAPKKRAKQRCLCGRGFRVPDRSDVHWEVINGVHVCGYCEPKKRGLGEHA